MDKKLRTINAYNENARSFAEKFDGLGARTEDIIETFNQIKKENPRVLEIGCGNGRDAREIAKRTDNYLGIDISEKLIELAREKVPLVRFEIADVESYPFPKELDIIFAFASLIHVPKDSLKRIIRRAHAALKKGGVIRLSMKWNGGYEEITKRDEYGVRTFYYYSEKDLDEMTDGFSVIKRDIHDTLGQKWLEILLGKN